MEFFIKQNATLPTLKMQVVKDGRSDYNNMMDFIEESAIFFSMVDVDTGIPKIITELLGMIGTNNYIQPKSYVVKILIIMHTSAYQNLQYFYERFCRHLTSDSIVLDFGSYSVNGSAKPIFAKHQYIGVDIAEGPNVDMIFNDYKLDLPDNYADAIVSSSCFEHDSFFWLTFLEMCRLIKPNEYFYIDQLIKNTISFITII